MSVSSSKPLDSEEERFEEAIALGMPVLDEKIALGKPVAGKDAFLLYDTYGFPLDLTQEIACENGLDVDVEGFEREMEAQRQRGRASAHFGGGRKALRAYEALDVRETAFLGYDRVETDTVVAGILKKGERVEKASAGDAVEIVSARDTLLSRGRGASWRYGPDYCLRRLGEGQRYAEADGGPHRSYGHNRFR